MYIQKQVRKYWALQKIKKRMDSRGGMERNRSWEIGIRKCKQKQNKTTEN